MDKKMTPVQIMNAVRPDAFAALVKAMTAIYGEANVYQTGDSEIAVKVGESPDGLPIYSTYSPTIHNYVERKTKSKTLKAYDAPAIAEKYRVNAEQNAADKAAAAERKAAQIARDKEERAKAKEQIEQKKADISQKKAMTYLEKMISAYTSEKAD